MSGGKRVTRVYGNFRGADFRGEECSLYRSPDCLNVWRDYREASGISTRPGMALVSSCPDPVYGIFFFRGEMLVHSGTRLYRDGVAFRDGLAEQVSDGFVYGDSWYFKDGRHYLRYDGTEIEEVAGKIPTTSIARAPGGGGTVYEDVNMLTPLRRNTFLADGASFDFYLDAQNIDPDFPPEVTVDGKAAAGYSVDFAEGKISFTAAPPAPLTDGQDNVEVLFSKTVPGYREAILGSTLLQVFDNRVFFSGNGDYPNVLWHSGLDDPTYISDMDYYREGMDEAKIRGMAAGNNALWVFRESSDANTNVFYHTPTIDDEYGKIYPSVHSSISIGCRGKAVNWNDDIVFFSDRGMEGITGDVTTEQAVSHRSSLVDRKLVPEERYGDMLLAEWEGYLLVIIGSHVYAADSRGVFTNENHVEYEWFYWELEKEVTCVRVQEGILYLGTAEGVYSLTDSAKPLESHWVTPKDKFQYPHLLKTTNKRGCVAEAAGDVQVFARTEDTAFAPAGEFGGVTDYFVGRIKRKKFKDIQLKIYSPTRFRLETVTLEAWVGGYIKR